ncbi:cellulose-binding protein [Streptomyces sp. NPDC059161]|uniref:cellulose-binding protein n=1 Tax=Streptomyces sp. NPDC059161 TaxID=3346749 RepID=UPI0036C107D0
MSAASMPPFGAGRGRGYRPEQVDRVLAGLGRERDAARERAEQLGALAGELEAGLAGLRERVTGLAPQTYEDLGGQAGALFALVVEEAEEVRAAAVEDSAAAARAAEEAGRAAKDAARAHAEAVLADAEAYARQVLHTARAEADELRRAAGADAEEQRAQAAAELDGTRRRCEAVLAGQEREQAETLEAAERELASFEAELTNRHDELLGVAEHRLDEARRAYAETEENARHGQEDAEARGAELLARARVDEERIARETERVLREHAEASDEARAHLAHVRASLAALTGRSTPED